MSLVISAETAGQFIPVDNFKAHLKSPKPLRDFTQFLNDVTEWVQWENRADEIRRHRKWVRSLMFYQGRQLGRFSSHGGYWRDIDPLPDDPYYVDNKFRFFAKSVRKEWVKSKGLLKAKGRSQSIPSQGAARAAKAVLLAEQERIWTPFESQRESNNAILTGNYFRYTYINPNAGLNLAQPVYEPQQVMVGQQGVGCGDCGYMGEMSPDPMAPEDIACPNCGSPNVDLMGGEMTTVPVQTGTSYGMTGRIVSEVVDPIEMKLHLHSRFFWESPYVERRRMMLTDVLESTYPWVSFNEGVPSASSGLWYQNNLERSPGNVSASGMYNDYGESNTDRWGKLAEFRQLWLDPVLYYNYSLPKDLELASGEVLPAGVALREIFPDGMYIAKVGSAYVDIRNENKNWHWVHGVYDLVSTNIWGDGNEDAVEQQRQHNEVSSLIFENIMHCDGPSTIYNPLKISRSQFSGKPREMVPLKNPTLADEPQKYVWQPNPRPLGAEPPSYRTMLEQSMQSSFGAFNVVNGLPDADNKTATGISIVREAATSLLAVPLEIKSRVDLIWGKQVLRLVQQHWTDELYMPYLGEHGQAEAQWFRSCDIDNDIELTMQADSWMPRTEAQLRNDMAEALAVGGMPGGIYSNMFPPDARPEAMRRWQIPFDDDKQAVDTQRQFIEIQKIVQLVGEAAMQNQAMGLPPQGAQVPVGAGVGQDPSSMVADGGSSPANPQPAQDPSMAPPMMQLGQDPLMMASMQVPVEPWVDEHVYHIEEIKRWLKTDQGDELAPIGSPARMAIMQHLEMHIQAQAMVAQMMMAMSAPPQAPGGNGGSGGDPNNPDQGKDKSKNQDPVGGVGNRPTRPPSPKKGEDK